MALPQEVSHILHIQSAFVLGRYINVQRRARSSHVLSQTAAAGGERVSKKGREMWAEGAALPLLPGTLRQAVGSLLCNASEKGRRG